MPIAPDFTPIYTQSFIIDYFDCDTNAQLKIVDLCKLLQVASSEHAVYGGISFWDLQENDQAWVVYKFRVEIDELPKWQDKIEITTWIEKLDGIRSVRNFELKKEGKVIVRASSIWVVMNTIRRRPEFIKIAHEHFTKYEDKRSIKGDFYTFAKKVETTPLAKDVVKYSDLDMVNHVTNIKYIEWIINAIKAKSLEDSTVSVLDMHFNKELAFNEHYDITQAAENPGHYLIHAASGNLSFQCLIE